MSINTDPEREQWRERLLDAQPQTPALRAEYERRVQAMFEIPLSRTRRIAMTVVLVAAVAMLGLFTLLLATETLPTRTRIAFGVGIVFAACWAALAARILRRGTFRRKADATLAANFAFGFSLTAAVLFAVATPDPNPFLVFGFLFLLPAAVVLLRTVIEQSELRIQERCLELEYRIARLSEQLGTTDPASGFGRPHPPEPPRR